MGHGSKHSWLPIADENLRVTMSQGHMKKSYHGIDELLVSLLREHAKS
jgi:hypothetical protein